MSGGSWVMGRINPLVVGPVAATGTQILTLGMGDCFSIGLEVTAATGTSETLDCVAQTSLDGTNWVDLPIRWTQKTTATSVGTPEWLVFRMGLGQNEVALGQVTADTGGQLVKNCIFNPAFFRVKYTIAGTNPSYTFKLNTMTSSVQRVA